MKSSLPLILGVTVSSRPSTGSILMLVLAIVIGLGVAVGLAFIPASIAKRKGYSFGLWWLYGWLLFLVALIHICVIPDKNAPDPSTQTNHISTADELKKYKELLDEGALTEKEFQDKKEQLLKKI